MQNARTARNATKDAVLRQCVGKGESSYWGQCRCHLVLKVMRKKHHEHLLGVFHLCCSEKKEIRKDEGFLPCKISPGTRSACSPLAWSLGMCRCHSTRRSNLHGMNQSHPCPISKGKRYVKKGVTTWRGLSHTLAPSTVSSLPWLNL